MKIKYSKKSLKFLAKQDAATVNRIRNEAGVMTSEAKKIAAMFDMLPKQEQDLAAELFKRIVLAWDPDFTKLTAYEEEQLKEAENSGYVDMEEIDWDNLDKY